MDAWVAADGKRGGADEADVRTVTKLGVQVGHRGNQERRHQLDEVLIVRGRTYSSLKKLSIRSIMSRCIDGRTWE